MNDISVCVGGCAWVWVGVCVVLSFHFWSCSLNTEIFEQDLRRI